jgi:ligand-binding SRPBCC domain-containing protein
MPFLHLTTFIEAPQQRVFDLSRSIRLHKDSMTRFEEKAISGTVTGLVQMNDEVTWQAKHLFKTRTMKVRITALKSPDFFCDEQREGDFTSLKHEHYFKPVENGTIMIDQFYYTLPYGTAGKVVNAIYLEKYMTRLLKERNEFLKKVAEGNQWKQYLDQ